MKKHLKKLPAVLSFLELSGVSCAYSSGDIKDTPLTSTKLIVTTGVKYESKSISIDVIPNISLFKPSFASSSVKSVKDVVK